MRDRVRRPPPTRSEPEPLSEHPLAGLPNHALARLLARAPKPDSQRTKVKEIGDLNATIGAAEWERTLNAGESVIPLYADIATQIGTAGLRDVEGTDAEHITRALTPDRVKPGLNFVSRGLSKGRTYYIEDGKPVNKLTVTAKGPMPQVAVCLGPAVFIPGNKAFALATLRHEIEHAAHNQMAVDWMQKWRDAGAKGDFRVWLGSQPIAAADRALVGERVDGSTVNTEVLAHLEGFITAFPKEDHATANPERSVYDQLTGVAEHWPSAAPDVQQEAIKRMLEMKRQQKGPALAALKAAFTRLKGEAGRPDRARGRRPQCSWMTRSIRPYSAAWSALKKRSRSMSLWTSSSGRPVCFA